METVEIKNCYDSHAHFVSTGRNQLGLTLKTLQSADDVKSLVIKPEHFQGDWLVGFGWDNHLWRDSSLPHKDILDKYFPDFPVLFGRVDGHAGWINSKGLQKLQLPHDESTGVLLERDYIQALMQLPKHSETQLKAQIKESIKTFNQAGFTHVRDLSMNSLTANLLHDLYNARELTICIDGFITAENVVDLERAYLDFQKCQQIKNPYLRFHGIKIFIDGSLGSETALISKNYIGKSHNGLLAWTQDEIKTALIYCWSRKIEIAIHTIGDLAVDIAVKAAREVSASGLLGKLHLEHVQLISPQTINLMKPLHIHCHIQPSHWLSDKKWIKSKIGDLSSYLFQWELLRKNKIPFSFGSDSPVEPTSLVRTYEALKDSSQFEIPALTADIYSYHAHPDHTWTTSKTVFDTEKIHSVYFNGEKIN